MTTLMHKKFRRWVDEVVRILTITETTLGEFWGSTTLMAMGLWLMLPFDTFGTIPVYDHMGHLLPEPTWGAFAFIVGAMQSVGNVMRNRSFRVVGAFCCSVFFGFFAALAMISAPASLLPPICGTASFVEGVVYLRLSVTNRRGGRGGT